jgi:aryl-alcohol dehydrogenase-like predicted oxidoreductase
VAIFTKVGSGTDRPGKRKGLARRWIERAAEASLERLGVDAIDLYFSHWPDAGTPHEETLRAYEALLQAGKIKVIGASNYDAAQLAAALQAAREHHLPTYQVLEPEYNLYARDTYEGALCDLCVAEGVGVVTYYSLASGFLSGKYRSEADFSQSARGAGMGKYLNARGRKILAALDAVAERHGAQPAEVALAWLMTRRGVTAPIASATSVAQVESFARAAELELDAEDLAKLA